MRRGIEMEQMNKDMIVEMWNALSEAIREMAETIKRAIRGIKNSRTKTRRHSEACDYKRFYLLSQHKGKVHTNKSNLYAYMSGVPP